MIRLFTVFLLSTLSVNAIAGTAVLYPRFSAFSTGASSSTFGSTFKIPPTETLSSNWGVKSGYFWQSADAGSLAATSRMSAADALAMTSAITGVSSASQSGVKLLAKGLLGGAVVTGVMFALPWLLEKGVLFINGQPMRLLSDGNTYQYYNNYGDPSGIFTSDRNTFCMTYFSNPYVSATNSCSGSGSFRLASSGQPTYGALTPALIDAATVNNRDLSDAELAEMVRLGYAVPILKPVATVIGDFSAMTAADLQILGSMGYFQKSPLTVNSGAPYIDPTTGLSMQPTLTLSPALNGGVRVTSSDQPINTNGTPATNPDGSPKPAQESKDPCAANPDSVTCSSLGSLDPSADPVPITHNVSLTPGTLSTAGSCPAPRSLTLAGHPVVMTFQPICDASSTYIRPFVLLASAVVSSFIFIGGLKS